MNDDGRRNRARRQAQRVQNSIGLGSLRSFKYGRFAGSKSKLLKLEER